MTSGSGAEPATAAGRGFRPDIEGLRAIAIGTVLLYHAGLPWVPGGFVGVDIFFVISGFLITSLMVREVERTGRVSLPAFWARRARRLLPASALVLVFSAALTWLVLPVTTRREFGGDIVAAAAYVVNWRLGYREVDYLAADVGLSPVQHYWSLAVEEQFYLVWPVLIAAVLLLARSHWRRATAVVLTLVTVASFAFAVHYSAVQPGLAFFVSTTRAWELGVGALLALALPRLQQLPAGLRAAAGWVGLAGIVTAALVYDDAAVWPGTATALPVLGAAALILAGAGARTVTWAPGRLLGIRPAVWLGGLSYSIYLWHWPFVVAADAIAGEHRIRWTVLATVLSLVPAWLSYTFVENPVRRGRLAGSTRAALSMGLVATVASAVAGVVVVSSVSLANPVDRASAAEAPGAGVLLAKDAGSTRWSTVDSVEKMRPSPFDEDRSDVPSIYRETDCIVGTQEDAIRYCDLGDPAADRTVALVGDSKAAQWIGPLDAIAADAGLRLLVVVKNGCTFADADTLTVGRRELKPSCAQWRAQVMAHLLEEKPEQVITSSRANEALPPGSEDPDETAEDFLVEGLARYWSTLEDNGVPVVAILDNPTPTLNTRECLVENVDDLTACTFPRAKAVRRSGAPAQLAAAERVSEVEVIDLTDTVCPDADTCPSVVGNVVVYRSGSHVGNTYAMTARKQLEEALWRATDGDLGSRPTRER